MLIFIQAQFHRIHMCLWTISVWKDIHTYTHSPLQVWKEHTKSLSLYGIRWVYYNSHITIIVTTRKLYLPFHTGPGKHKAIIWLLRNIASPLNHTSNLIQSLKCVFRNIYAYTCICNNYYCKNKSELERYQLEVCAKIWREKEGERNYAIIL